MEGEVETKKMTKKASKGLSSTSKLKTTFADVPKQSPLRYTSVRSDQYSGLWECYYDNRMVGDGVEGGGMNLRNICGFLLKRRKSPLKGWHKRFFVLEKGMLKYSRNQTQLQKGKVLGTVDLGLAFITCDSTNKRINIDGEHHVYHLKMKNASHFAAWSSCLMSQEVYRKAQLAETEGGAERPVQEGVSGLVGFTAGVQETVAYLKGELDVVRENMEAMSILIKAPSHHRTPSATSTGDLKTPEGNGLDSVSLHSHQSSVDSTASQSGSGSGSGTGTGTGKKIHVTLRRVKKKQDKKMRESAPNLSPDSFLSQSTSPLDEPVLLESNIIRDDFGNTAKTVYNQFCDMAERFERLEEGLKKAIEHEMSFRLQQQKVILNQQLLLRQSLIQNNELRDRLSQIQALTSGILLEPPRMVTPSRRPTPTRSMSFISLHSSISDKFYDALDDFHELSSESEDEGENTPTDLDESPGEDEDSSDEMFSSLTADVLSSLNMTANSPSLSVTRDTMPTISETVTMETKPLDQSHDPEVKRRTQLPSPRVDVGDFSLWTILRKNIGKDLSKVSMPVTMNEPLSALQRLCEELQYSELLDEAAGMNDVHDRMVRIAAFAVSAYALSYYRAGRKPFNPILGETYECVREDKGFKFISEQVSHHPPIAACHCKSLNFSFWQDARIKSKFWGKSMEVFPIGTVNVTLPKHGDHYQWTKVTSCIHNVFAGQRWVDQYGEMVITNEGKSTCKLMFIKASYWSSKKYEVHGDVYNSDGQQVRHLFGTWHEAMFCGDPENAQCIWRAAPMPPDHEQYYNFNQFAIELNDLEEGIRDKLPPTDSRFRPDQRLVEEGRLQDAETEKHRVEQIQRAARAERERLGEEWTPVFFRKEQGVDDDCWVFKDNYWSLRENGFTGIKLPVLW